MLLTETLTVVLKTERGLQHDNTRFPLVVQLTDERAAALRLRRFHQLLWKWPQRINTLPSGRKKRKQKTVHQR